MNQQQQQQTTTTNNNKGNLTTMAEAQIEKAAALASQKQQQQRSAASLLLKLKNACKEHQPLVPIRIDVSSQNSSSGNSNKQTTNSGIRIIDTLLLDPQVWPIPLVFERLYDDDDDDGDEEMRAATEDSIEANVRFWAHHVLTDAEVQGMGRTTRHFTGRADLWSASLQEAIMDQIRPQIQVIANENAAKSFWNAQSQRKKKKRQATETSTSAAAAKKVKATSEETKKPDQQQQQQSSANAPAPATTPPSPPPRPSCYVPTPLEQARLQYLTRAIQESSSSSSSSSSCLIPIRIRMSVHGIRIHDDFLWDPNLHLTTTATATATTITAMNALEFARITGKDLNLPDEAIQAMAVDIVEQIHGLTMCRDDDNNKSNNNNNNNNFLYKQELSEIIVAEKKRSNSNEPHSRHNVTAAWLLDSRKHAMDAAHLVSQHRPSNS
jgi:hypothetical protein